jgi:predicted transcriptional regulator
MIGVGAPRLRLWGGAASQSARNKVDMLLVSHYATYVARQNSTSGAQFDKLARREREIMDALFALGDRATAEQIRERLSDPPSYSAVRTMLSRLEVKGYLRHREEGLRYVYTPAQSRTSVQRRALEKLVDVFFAGSRAQMAAALLRQERWSDDELDALSAEIEAVRKERKGA